MLGETAHLWAMETTRSFDEIKTQLIENQMGLSLMVGGGARVVTGAHYVTRSPPISRTSAGSTTK